MVLLPASFASDEGKKGFPLPTGTTAARKGERRALGSTLLLVFSPASKTWPRKESLAGIFFLCQKSIWLKLSGQSNGVEKWRGDNLFSICGHSTEGSRQPVCTVTLLIRMYSLSTHWMFPLKLENWNLCAWRETICLVGGNTTVQGGVVPRASQEVYLMPRPLLQRFYPGGGHYIAPVSRVGVNF